MVRCAERGEESEGIQAATEHYYATHGNPDDQATA
jgi:hypothetical protein